MFKYITTFAAALTPLLYFHGAFFHESYIRALGAPPDLFRLSFEELLLQGFAVYMMIGLPALILITMYLSIALGAAYNLNEATKISFIKRMVDWLSSKLKAINFIDKTPGHEYTEETVRIISKVLIIVLILLILLGSTLWLAIEAEALGKKNAKNMTHAPEKTYSIQDIHLKNGATIRGYTLQCSNYGCIVLTTGKIQILPLEKIDSIDAFSIEN